MHINLYKQFRMHYITMFSLVWQISCIAYISIEKLKRFDMLQNMRDMSGTRGLFCELWLQGYDDICMICHDNN